MYTILSPSKTQDFHRTLVLPKSVQRLVSIPQWNKQTRELVKVMKGLSTEELGKLMNISSKLAQLTFERFQDWDGEYSNDSIHALAIHAFLGDVYKGFKLDSWRDDEYLYAHKHLGIVSGLYGLISPLNYIHPYRLEMGVPKSFTVGGIEHKNLYAYWREVLTEEMFKILKKENVLINLASVEYSKVFDREEINMKNKAKIIDIDFKIKKDGTEKVIAIYAKRARGMMANWIIENKVDTQRELEKFAEDGWEFKGWSKEDTLGNVRGLFVRV